MKEFRPNTEGEPLIQAPSGPVVRAAEGPDVCQAGAYVVHCAKGPAALARSLTLRNATFRQGCSRSDEDGFDADSLHLSVSLGADPRILACGRARVLTSDGALSASYTGSCYDLSALVALPGPWLELGRVSAASDPADPAPMRLLWARLAALALETGVRGLFGCTSFAVGSVPDLRASLQVIIRRQTPPSFHSPAQVWCQSESLAGEAANAVDTPKLPSAVLPPLLRSYLALGAWIGPDLVIDRDLGTAHVFTCLELDRMNAGRRHSLEADAARLDLTKGR